MRTLKTSQNSNAGRVIFANSITLTPGTVSVYVEKGEVTIHALSQASANSYEDGSMDARVSALEIKGK